MDYSMFLARSANLPEGLYILPMFFLYFSSVSFHGRLFDLVAQNLMDRSSPKFPDW